MAQLLGHTRDGSAVYAVDQSHCHRPDLAAEALARVIVPDAADFVLQTVDMGRVIGVDHLLTTQPGDPIVFMRRGDRPYPSRMVLKEAAPTSLVTVILCREDAPGELHGELILATLYEGQPAEREVGDPSLTTPEAIARSEDFWATHALAPTEVELSDPQAQEALATWGMTGFRQ